MFAALTNYHKFRNLKKMQVYYFIARQVRNMTCVSVAKIEVSAWLHSFLPQSLG